MSRFHGLFQRVCRSCNLINLFLTLISLAIIFIDKNHLPCLPPKGSIRRTNKEPCYQSEKELNKFMFLFCVYVLYLFECGVSEIKEYLSNNREALSYEDYIRKIKTSAPLIGTRIECFNHSASSNLNFITYEEDCYFRYSSWEDATVNIKGAFSKAFVKLETEKTCNFGNINTEERFKAHREDCLLRNCERDKGVGRTPILEVPGYQGKAFFHKKGTKRPFYLNLWSFWISSLCLLSWPYRMWLESLSDRERIVLRKVVYA